MREIVQLLRERIEQGLLTIFIKIKTNRGESLNELADRWADEGRQSKNIRWSLPTNRLIFSWTAADNGKIHQSPIIPTRAPYIPIHSLPDWKHLGEEQEHEENHLEQDSPKHQHDPQVFLYCTKLQDRVDTALTEPEAEFLEMAKMIFMCSKLGTY